MAEKILSLAELNPGESGRVLDLTTTGPMRRRLFDLGLVPGTQVQVLFASPSGDPVAYAVRGAVIALRRQGAKQILLAV